MIQRILNFVQSNQGQGHNLFQYFETIDIMGNLQSCIYGLALGLQMKYFSFITTQTVRYYKV